MPSILAAPRPERLLLVEDDEFSNQLIELYLRKAGYTEITVAVDGKQAFEIAREQPFDMIILDLNLPQMSGTEVLRRLKKEGAQQGTPVLIISSLSNVEETAQCLELGAEDYLPKPFNTRLLAARIEACLEIRRLRDEAANGHTALERDLTAARALRRVALPADLPAEPWPDRVEVAAHSILTDAVGGDIREVFVRRDGTFCVAVGSLALQGSAAALTATRLSLLLRQAAETAAEPHEVLAVLDHALAAGEGTATLFVAMLGPNDDYLRIANADHRPPYRLDAQHGPRPLEGRRGPPLGDSQERGSDRLALDEDCRLVLCTQGVAAMMKEYALRGCLEDLAAAPPSEIVATLRREVQDARPQGIPPADATILALKVGAK